MRKVKFTSIFLLFALAYAQEEFKFESEKLGKIKGEIEGTFSGQPYISFRGIPYASVKTNGRFMPSVLNTGKLVPGSDGYFDAKYPHGDACVQSMPSIVKGKVDFGSIERFIMNSEQVLNGSSVRTESSREAVTRAAGSEDCLFLNIFTRDVNPKKSSRTSQGQSINSASSHSSLNRVPVIVFIHGGAFTSGSGNFYEGHRLLDHNVVLVSINYRLGVLGFFCLGVPEAAGNEAMYDMVNALKWIQANIEDFGGDPNSVTVIGQSAGSAAVIQLMSSPIVASATPPLLHKVVALSGSGVNEWATTSSERAIAASLRIAELLKCYTPVEGVEPDAKAIITCMKGLTDLDLFVDQLSIYQAEEQLVGRLGYDGTTPVIQTAEAPGYEKFMDRDPLETFNAGKQMPVPLIMGNTLHDGSYPLGVLYNNYLVPNSYQNNPEFLRNDLIPTFLKAFGLSDESGAVYDAIAKTYLGDSRDSGEFNQIMPGLIDLHSVFFFKADTYKTMEVHSETVSDSFWYSFDYLGGKTLFDLLFGNDPPPVFPGVSHADDLIYIFAIPFLQFLNDEEKEVSRQFVQYLVNFAQTGNPNRAEGQNDLTEWPYFNTSSQQFLSLRFNSEVMDNYKGSWESSANVLKPVTPTPSPSPSSTLITSPPPSSTLATSPTFSPLPSSAQTSSSPTLPSSTTEVTEPSTTDESSATYKVLFIVFAITTVLGVGTSIFLYVKLRKVRRMKI